MKKGKTSGPTKIRFSQWARTHLLLGGAKSQLETTFAGLGDVPLLFAQRGNNKSPQHKVASPHLAAMMSKEGGQTRGKEYESGLPGGYRKTVNGRG